MPIGIFDSGVGGLTVMKEVMKELPHEDIIYLGDTARVPYGGRSPETIIKYSIENAEFLVSKGIKLLIVACNTSSAVSLDILSERMPVPVIGVVNPGARAAASKTKHKRIAVIGTETTIRSGSYIKAIKAIDSSIEVTGIACPLFVPLIEEGWINGEVVTLVVQKYLSSLTRSGADALVLGCTHYPMIKDIIAGVVDIPLIDSAIETAREARLILQEKGMLRNNNSIPFRDFFVTDAPEKFTETGRRFLGHDIFNISKIELGG
ncbi:MAG: glutamate racemase [Thermodesulfovibrionia bacterium]|nr:glutamate racemase [Thermodesulfovibrionia bacterium]